MYIHPHLILFVTMISTSLTKESKNLSVGVVLKKHPTTGDMLVSKVRPGGLAEQQAKLVPGMKIKAINNISVEQMSLEQCIALFRCAVGKVDIQATPAPEPIILSGTKEAQDSKVGLGFARDKAGAIIVSSITEHTIFDTDQLKKYMRVLEINGIEVDGMRKEDAIMLLRNAIGEVNLLVVDYDPEM